MQGVSSNTYNFTNTSNLNILYFNTRSLLPKIDELRLSRASCRPDVVCIVETWLSDEIADCEIDIPDFCITRLDRNRHGGGIAFYVRSCLLYIPRFCYSILLT